jgi:hypothetical protein
VDLIVPIRFIRSNRVNIRVLSLLVATPFVVTLCLQALPSHAEESMADTVKAEESLPPASSSEQLKNDLSLLDGLLNIEPNPGQQQAILRNIPLRSQDTYRTYSKRLFALITTMNKINGVLTESALSKITLQQVAALNHQLKLQHKQFRESFRHQEQQLYTYQLVLRAVLNLNDAVSYWQLSDRYKADTRGSSFEQLEDDEYLQVKLKGVLQSIAALKEIKDFNAMLERTPSSQLD